MKKEYTSKVGRGFIQEPMVPSELKVSLAKRRNYEIKEKNLAGKIA